MRTLFLLIAVSILSIRSAEADESQFATIKLPHQIQVELPKSWRLIGADFNAVIDTSAQAALDMSGIETPANKDVDLIAANSTPASTYASVRLSYSTPPMGSPETLKAAAPAEVKALDSEIETKFKLVLAQQGLLLLDYIGTTVEDFDGHPTLVIQYRRSGPKGPVLVWVYQVFLKEATVKMTLSYRESEAVIWKPVIQKIKTSFKCPIDA